MRVPQGKRAPRQDIVNVAIAVHVLQICALPPGDEARDAADSAKGAHGAIDTARDQFLRAREEPRRFRRLHADLPCSVSLKRCVAMEASGASSLSAREATSCPWWMQSG